MVIKMKIEVTWEDYNDIIMAIAVAKASSGLRFGHDYEMLRQDCNSMGKRRRRRNID